MASEDDTYAREVIRAIREVTEGMAYLRQDITRATAPLFPRILGLERRLDEDLKDRKVRQAENDARFDSQDKVLERLERRSLLRFVLDIAIVVGIAALFYLLLLHR